MHTHMARHLVKNGHKKDTCYNELGLCAQHKDRPLLEVLVINAYEKVQSESSCYC